jgi:hypothetical protein
VNAQERAFGSERIWNARRAALMRVAIVGTFLINTLVLVFVVRAWPFNAATGMFLVYFLLALVLLVLTRRETVNLAAHLEQLTRETDGGILLTDDTRRKLDGVHALEPEPALVLGEPYASIPLYRYVGTAP